MTTSYGYDGAGRLTSVAHGGTGIGSQFSYLYTLDPAGNRTAVAYGGGSETYTLDVLNRVTGVTYLNGDVASYTYDDADQLTSDGTNTYSYDQAGNLTAVGADSYTWDWANRLSGATVGGNTVSYSYDGQGLKVSETTGANTTTYIYDQVSGLPLLVDDGTNAYLHAGGLVSQIDGANAASYPLSDALGSVRGLTDGTGTLTGSSDYAIFGAPRNPSGATSRFGFTGEPADATTCALDLRARHYDPDTGRFLSADTVQPNAPGSQGFNRYAYVANNPMRYTDPTGHTISDVEEGMEILQQLTAALVAVGALIQATLPLMLLPFLGFALALFFFMLILTIVAAMFMVIGQILELLLDEFDHYQGDAPNDPNPPDDPDDLPEEPDKDPCSEIAAGSGGAQTVVGLYNGQPPDLLIQCIGGPLADLVTPPLSLADILTFLDLAPIAELCLATVPVYYLECEVIESVIGTGAFIAAMYEIENSGCDEWRQDAASAAVSASVLVDVPAPGLLAEETVEYSLFFSASKALDCG